MSQYQALLILGAMVAGSFLIGLYGERLRAKWARRRWRANHPVKSREREQQRFRVVAPLRNNGRQERPALDAADQLRLVMSAQFEKRRLLSAAEARVFYAAEKAVRTQGLGWRVMAQVSLGEILSSPDTRAFSTINSKRVDILLISKSGDPIAAIEFQGDGHYQGTAPARDAVKKEALRKAGVGYIEMTPAHGPEDLAREISRIAGQTAP